MTAPIALFAYRRADHLQRTVDALRENALASETPLYIFSDGPKNSADAPAVNAVREVIRGCRGFASISSTEQLENRGLARSVIAGVTQVLKEHEQVIVVEDDLVTSKDFLTFLNQALALYRDLPRVFSVTGYNHPFAVSPAYSHDAYFSPRCSSHGWATWRDRWARVDWAVEDYPRFRVDWREQARFNCGGDDLSRMLRLQMRGKLDSWAIRWCYAHFKNDALCLYPTRSKVLNIGWDGSGTHCSVDDRFSMALEAPVPPYHYRLPERAEVDEALLAAGRAFTSLSLSEKLETFLKFQFDRMRAVLGVQGERR